MSQITPERAGRALDRAVDFGQLFGLLAAVMLLLAGGQLMLDDAGAAGFAVIAAGLVCGAMVMLLTCWARAWLLASLPSSVSG